MTNLSRHLGSTAALAAVLLMVPTAAATEAPEHLTLQLPFADDLTPLIGPPPAVLNQPPPFAAGAEPGLRLGEARQDPRGRYLQTPTSPLLQLPARGLLRNAQGAVSLWLRPPRVSDPEAKDFPVLLQLDDSGGGTWSLAVRETPYKQKSDALTGAQARDLAAASAREYEAGLEVSDSARAQTAVELDETAAPVATVACRAHIKLWPEGTATTSVDGRLDVPAHDGWHHLVWTWRSLHHDLYIDGRRVAGDTPQSRISRMAPITSDAARLTIFGCSAVLREFRLYDRWLDADQVQRLTVLPATEYLQPLPPVRVWTDWAASTGRAVVYVDVAGASAATRVELSCRRSDGEAVLCEVSLPALPEALGEIVLQPFAPDPFPAGKYLVTAVVLDADGKALGRADTTTWENLAKPWPFLGFKGGRPEAAQTAVMPPFTPVTVDGDVVNTVRCRHRIDRSGLFASVVAAGRELLAGAIRLEVVVAGQPLAFSRGPGLSSISRQPQAADWQAETRSEQDHRLTVAAHLEYDGVTRFDLTLTTKASLGVDGVQLIIPFRPETVRLCHSGLSWWFGSIDRDAAGVWSCRRINWVGPGEPRARRPGVLFDSFDKTLGLFPPPTRQIFTPYMHLGNDDRGLSWFVENDRNWHHDPAIPPLEFVADGDTAYLRLNLIAKATQLSTPTTWRFYLLANPYKPMPPKWRTWGVGHNRRNNALLQASEHLFWWHWSEYAGAFRPYPGPAVRYDDRPAAADTGAHALAAESSYEDWRDKFRNDDVRHLPFINFGTPGGFPDFSDATMVHPYTWKLHNNQPHRDYVAYWLDRCVRDIGIDGVYIDEPYSEPYSYNVLAGDAPYIRSDGTRALGFRYLEGRAYVRRLKQLFTDHGIDYSIWLHNTNYRALPVMTFADIGMDGEHPQIWVPEFDDYRSFYQPERSRGYIAGHAFGFVGAQMYHATTNPKGDDALARIYRKDRTYLAVTLPYGVLPMTTTFPQELDRIQNVNAAFGLAALAPEELDLADLIRLCPGFSIEPSVRGITALRLPQQERALLYLDTPAPAYRITGDLRALTGGKQVHMWQSESGATLPLTADGWRLQAAPEFTCVWVAGRETAQAVPPEGVLLQVDFDRGFAPDLGGGLIPTAPSNGAALPAPTAGRSGGGLAISAGDPEIGYAVVPSWTAGAIQFDLQLQVAGRQPLRLLGLRHHLDCDLSVAARDGVSGLLLSVRETPLVLPLPAADYSTGRIKAEEHSRFVPLPAVAANAWHRIVLTWRAGRYRIFDDGNELAALLTMAAPRLRDDQAPVCGVLLGNRSEVAMGKAVIDSVEVSDQPWPRDPADAFATWYDPEAQKSLRAVAEFGRHPDAARVTHVRFSLRVPGVDPAVAAVADVVPWCNAAWAALPMSQPKPASALDEFGEDLPAARPNYSLRVELIRRHGKDPTDEILDQRQQALELDVFSTIEADF